MSRICSYAIIVIFLSFMAASIAAADQCVECHKKITPNIVSDWQLSKHSQNAIGCEMCHRDKHKSEKDVASALCPRRFETTPIEQKLFVMFLEHRMRAFQGTFHANPDYALWYGWSEIRQDATEIKYMAEDMRKAR